MSGPNLSISPAQLWVEITKLPRPSRIIDFPRLNTDGKPLCQIMLTVLSPTEQIQCVVEAERYVNSKLGITKIDERASGYKTVFDTASATECLFLSARSADDVGVKFFPSSQAIRDVLTADETGVLMQAYGQMTAEMGPIISTMNEKDMEAWLERLALGADIVNPFWLLSSEQKNDLLKYSAVQLWSSRRDNSLLGTRAEESTSDLSS